METKHQVFVSSTYSDLIEERKAVIHALLELDCIPAGMELFPATDEDAWTLIREIIDGCDYYILILAGKYGSLSPGGVSYTEMEFDYAVSINKPIIVFIHENPDELKGNNIEKTEARQEMLANFTAKAKTKHCKFWSNAEDLGGKVSRSLVQLKKRHPSPGWVPGKFAASDAMLQELQELRARVSQMESESTLYGGEEVPGTEDLAQGEDLVNYELNVTTKQKERKKINVSCTWDNLFAYVGPSMLNECTDEEFSMKIRLAIYHVIPNNERKNIEFSKVILAMVFLDKIRVQFQALGYIVPGIKRRAVSDTNQYWRLTSHGQKYLVRIRAQRR